MDRIIDRLVIRYGFFRRIADRPYVTFIGIFVIVNGILTFFPSSAVIQILNYHFGALSFIVPIFQILAGGLKVFGAGLGKGNLEVGGMLMVSALFLIRALALVSDGDVSLQDINSITIAFCLIMANMFRIRQVLVADRAIKEGRIE
jgi:hypothetical protein